LKSGHSFWNTLYTYGTAGSIQYRTQADSKVYDGWCIRL